MQKETSYIENIQIDEYTFEYKGVKYSVTESDNKITSIQAIHRGIYTYLDDITYREVKQYFKSIKGGEKVVNEIATPNFIYDGKECFATFHQDENGMLVIDSINRVYNNGPKGYATTIYSRE